MRPIIPNPRNDLRKIHDAIADLWLYRFWYESFILWVKAGDGFGWRRLMARNIWGTRIPDKRGRYSKVTFTKYDSNTEYFKMFLYLLLGYLYFHFIVMGWEIWI